MIYGCPCYDNGVPCSCSAKFKLHFYDSDFTKLFEIRGKHLNLCLLACVLGEYELGFLMVQTMSPEKAQLQKTIYNQTLLHMYWGRTLETTGGERLRRLERGKQYANYLVDALGCDIDAKISLEYNQFQGQDGHPAHHGVFDEEWDEEHDGLGLFTPLMYAIHSRSFDMAVVLADLGADWHTLVNAQGQTAYRMLVIAAWEEQYIPGPNLTCTFAVPVALKRVLRSLLRRYAPVLA